MSADPAGTAARVLDVHDLSVEFEVARGRWVRVVDHVSFGVDSGRVLAIVGESGSGKSVSALAIMGLLPRRGARTTGTARLLGDDLLTMSRTDLLRVQGARLAMVFQEPMTSLNPAFTVGEQISETLRHHLGMSRAAATRRAIELLDEVGIPQAARRIGSYPHEFSGGMRQRVMIAMALSCNPALLFCDEPTTALDVTIQAQIMELLRDVSRQHDMGVVFITHDFGVVAEIADEVTVLYAGQVVESADVMALFEAPQHPYTEALLGIVASLEDDGDEILWIPGSPPLPGRFSSGCRFSSRCGHAVERCSHLMPELAPRRSEGLVRCHLAAELHLQGRD